ncbi:Mur ligase family protein [Curtobacterium sp. VKM Ac-1376]|uniref:Mur ligase family protein n=1 Tax=Curtobacterium sp. VKM Ac-1376 TaxID=123312 RepID=UPI00188CE0F6|nr:UDP-N-acetylmuramyl-tripeptide synthetase [Curtobacterium sp. VKM Ac-1376]MBF4613151.1 UDP-N-acetylmuramyl-tripeptide synthetase [Curtobacterium sp. VKM Ac-1376]
MPHAFRPARPRTVRLDELALVLGVDSPGDGTVTGLALATDQLRQGMLFAALPGRVVHGAEHAGAARAAGAAAVLTDPDGQAAARRSGLPVLVVPGVRGHLGTVARLLAGTATLPFPLFGVTGTNGKTSTVHLLHALMRRLGWRTAISSTVERRIVDESLPSALTTPEAPELHAFLARAAERRVDGAALEVSAQGLSRHRTDGVLLDVAGFTNLSHDHLDDYADMDEYLAAKAVLFTPARTRSGVVSLDSRAGGRIVARATVPVTTISTDPAAGADWTVVVRDQRPDGTRSTLTAPDGTALDLDLPLLGVHMAANAGLAVAMLATAGVPVPALLDATQGPLDVVVPGRMADASAATGPRVFVDFAHTPDAFAKSLAAVRAFATGRVAIVLGADGDRDTSKRSAMGAVAAAAADVVVVADHHPRFEDPAPIRAAIVDGARRSGHDALVVEEPDPARAIRRALAEVGDDGVVYWAGPGLTDYRDVRGVHVPYSSFRDAQAALTEAGHPAGVRHEHERVSM